MPGRRIRGVLPGGDERVGEFLNRPLTGDWPQVWLDATCLGQRQGGRIVSVAAITAVAANTGGRREIIGPGIGPSQAETFWTDFLRSLKSRGLDGVRLVIHCPTGHFRKEMSREGRRPHRPERGCRAGL